MTDYCFQQFTLLVHIQITFNKISSNIHTIATSFQLIFSKVENSRKLHDSFSDFIELRQGQGQETETQENDFSASEGTHQSVNVEFKLANEPILRQVEKRCPLLAEEFEKDDAGNNEASVSRLMTGPQAQRRTDAAPQTP